MTRTSAARFLRVAAGCSPRRTVTALSQAEQRGSSTRSAVRSRCPLEQLVAGLPWHPAPTARSPPQARTCLVSLSCSTRTGRACSTSRGHLLRASFLERKLDLSWNRPGAPAARPRARGPRPGCLLLHSRGKPARQALSPVCRLWGLGVADTPPTCCRSDSSGRAASWGGSPLLLEPHARSLPSRAAAPSTPRVRLCPHSLLPARAGWGL